MAFTEELVAGVVLDVLGTTELDVPGTASSRSPTPWAAPTDGRADERGARRGRLGAHAARAARRAPRRARRRGARFVGCRAAASPNSSRRRARPRCGTPIFVTEYPVEVSPLARRHRATPSSPSASSPTSPTRELSNGFSELNDPVEQRRALRRAGPTRRGGRGRDDGPSTRTTSRRSSGDCRRRRDSASAWTAWRCWSPTRRTSAR